MKTIPSPSILLCTLLLVITTTLASTNQALYHPLFIGYSLSFESPLVCSILVKLSFLFSFVI